MYKLEIVIGMIIKKDKVYITRGKYKENIWEFPGGKIKKNETLSKGLKRELLEEVGITVLNFRFFQYVQHYDCRKKIKLYFFIIDTWKGRVFSREGYFYTWVFFYNLKFFNFPSANRSIINSFEKNKNIINIF